MRQNLARLIGHISRLRRDTSAVSAVEFAILVPVMLLLLLGTFDIARAIDVKNKTMLLSRTVSDFVSQSRSVTPAQLATIIQASRSVMYPYASDSSVLQIKIESIRKSPTNENEFIIDWSYTPTVSDAKTDPVLDTDEFTPPDASVVLTKVDYTYDLKFAGFLFDRIGFKSINMLSTNYMAPRWGVPVEASGFP
jgi:Flp pilus assembly protein TadG